jgi:hypothetical protein
VNAAGNLAGREESRDRLLLRVEDFGAVVDLEAAHGVVQDRRHDGDVERTGVVLPVRVVEELLAEGVFLRILADLHVLVERSLQLGSRDAHLLGDIFDGVELFHQPATDVVLRARIAL